MLQNQLRQFVLGSYWGDIGLRQPNTVAKLSRGCSPSATAQMFTSRRLLSRDHATFATAVLSTSTKHARPCNRFRISASPISLPQSSRGRLQVMNAEAHPGYRDDLSPTGLGLQSQGNLAELPPRYSDLGRPLASGELREVCHTDGT